MAETPMAPLSGPVDRVHETAALLLRHPNAHVRPLRPISPPSGSLPILGPRGLRRLDGPDLTGPERPKGFLKPYPYLSGCASIVSHSSWPVAIKSKPDQADFTITNKKGEKIHTGTTPATVTLTSGSGYFSGETYNVTFGKNGYQDKTGTVDTGINGWYWVNFLFGGFIGVLIFDPATGAMWRLPESYHADLLEKVKTSGDAPRSFRI
jgi:hypothetical protein